MSRFTMAALALIAVIAGGWFLMRPDSSALPAGVASASDMLVGAAHAQDVEYDTSTIVDMQLGDPDAPVTVIEYASYTCPHCATFHSGNYKLLKSEYIDTGKVNFIYREVYFDRPGLWASAVARCAGPERFFGVTDLIYAQQSEWTASRDPAVMVEELRKIGRLAGLQSETIEACLQDGEKLRSLVAWFQENAEEHNIRSTPSFVINGTTHGNMSWADMKSLIDAAS